MPVSLALLLLPDWRRIASNEMQNWNANNSASVAS
jgi:hypothetical protein